MTEAQKLSEQPLENLPRPPAKWETVENARVICRLRTEQALKIPTAPDKQPRLTEEERNVCGPATIISTETYGPYMIAKVRFEENDVEQEAILPFGTKMELKAGGRVYFSADGNMSFDPPQAPPTVDPVLPDVASVLAPEPPPEQASKSPRSGKKAASPKKRRREKIKKSKRK